MVFLWVSYGFLWFPMVFLWFSYGFLWFPMVFLWFPMVFLWFPMVSHESNRGHHMVPPAAPARLREARRGQDLVRQQSEAGIAAVISTLPRRIRLVLVEKCYTLWWTNSLQWKVVYSGFSWDFIVIQWDINGILPSGERLHFAMERSTMLFSWVVIHYFDWAIFHGKMLVHQMAKWDMMG